MESSLALLDGAAAAQDKSECMNHAGKTEDRQHCFTGFMTFFVHFWGGARIHLWLEIALVSKNNCLPFPSSQVLLCNGLKSDGGRESWIMSQVPVIDSHTSLIIKPLVRMQINL